MGPPLKASTSLFGTENLCVNFPEKWCLRHCGRDTTLRPLASLIASWR